VVMVRPRSSLERLTGGGEVSTIQTALHLRGLGVDVYTIERRPSVILRHARDLKAHTLGKNQGLIGDIIGVIKMIRETRCDTVYAYTDYVQETIVPCFLAAFVTHRKLFVNVLGAPGVSGRRTEDSQSFIGLIRERVRLKPGFRSLVRYALFQASRRLGCRTGTCLVATHFVESYTRSLLHSRRTYVVGGGVEKLWFDKTGAEKTYDGVYSGRFDRSKRVSTLVRAWKMVVTRKPDAKLLLIGDSGAEFPLVERLITDLGLSSNVTLAGFVKDRVILADMVRSARLFIFPSVKEGFGLVVAEAMAAGLACILSDIPPLREVFGGSAVFVHADDPTAFADAIIDLLSDRTKLTEYSERSRLLAKNFSWDGVARKVLSAMTMP
jgi:glycosyltransferase involved in cell wall biosynthesis